MCEIEENLSVVFAVKIFFLVCFGEKALVNRDWAFEKFGENVEYERGKVRQEGVELFAVVELCLRVKIV